MKIAFLITSINSKSGGLGGHYHSLVETVTQIAKHHEVLIVNIGNNEAKALQDTNFKTYKIINSEFSFFKTHKELKKILTSEKPNILHAFDALAYYWTRLVGRQLQIPYCLTKCGGVNPKYYFPYTKNLVLFSNENLVFFKNNLKFRDTMFSLIPNRIKPFNDDQERINQIYRELGDYKKSFKFLRISRVGNYYRDSTYQLIELVSNLQSEGIQCCAIFIGAVEDEKLYEELTRLNKKYLFFFREEHFTRDAKGLINCADVVLGTGRSFMEAAAKEKIMLCPTANSIYPVLIDPEKFQVAFNYNFSERIKFDSFDECENYRNIKAVIASKTLQTEAQSFSINVYNSFFNSDKIANKYNEFYSTVKVNSKKHLLDFLLHTLFIFRSYFR